MDRVSGSGGNVYISMDRIYMHIVFLDMFLIYCKHKMKFWASYNIGGFANWDKDPMKSSRYISAKRAKVAYVQVSDATGEDDLIVQDEEGNRVYFEDV